MIQSTTNYDQFKFLERNRVINNSHLLDLEKSISEDNRLAQNPIIVNQSMEIIDGQHRLEVARKLGVPIYYTEAVGAGIETVARLQIQRKWTMYDWVYSYEKGGNENYAILHKFFDYYGLPVSICVSFLMGVDGWKSGGHASRVIRDGTFRVVELKQSEIFAEKFVEIRNSINKKFASARTFILAVRLMMDNPQYDHKRMLGKLELYSKKLSSQESVNEYLRDLEHVYNMKAHGKDVRLF